MISEDSKDQNMRYEQGRDDCGHNEERCAEGHGCKKPASEQMSLRQFLSLAWLQPQLFGPKRDP
jgi:hypothetical protein